MNLARFERMTPSVVLERIIQISPIVIIYGTTKTRYIRLQRKYSWKSSMQSVLAAKFINKIVFDDYFV